MSCHFMRPLVRCDHVNIGATTCAVRQRHPTNASDKWSPGKTAAILSPEFITPPGTVKVTVIKLASHDNRVPMRNCSATSHC